MTRWGFELHDCRIAEIRPVKDGVEKDVIMVRPPGIIGPSSLYSESLTRDKLGRIKTSSETIMSVTHVYEYEYEYDPAARLKRVTTDGVVTLDLTYDLNGNPVVVQDHGGT